MGADGKVFRSPFKRPWMVENGAAAPAAGNTGVKGIIAGKQVKLLHIFLKIKCVSEIYGSKVNGACFSRKSNENVSFDSIVSVQEKSCRPD